MIVEIDTMTIRALMERSFTKYASQPSVAFAGGEPISFDQLKESVAALAVEVSRHGMKKGDKIAILGENSPNWVKAYLATVMTGMTAVPILPNFSEEDIRHIIRDSGARALFVSGKQRKVVEEHFDSTDIQLLIDLDDLEIKALTKQGAEVFRETVRRIKEMISGEADIYQLFDGLPKPVPEDLAVIIYTSGTTGHSKGVMLTHKNIASDVVYSIEKFPIDDRDRFLSILPLSHTFEATGGLLCPLSVGTSIYYMEGVPTAKKLLVSMSTVKPTGVLTVPLVIDKIYRNRILPNIQGKAVTRSLYRVPFFRKQLNKIAGKKLIKSLGGALRFFMFGGAALNDDVETFLRDAGISYSTGYGMTECSPIMTINPFGKVRAGSCGQPIPGIELKIHEPDPESGLGEIIAKGPMIMKGYYKNEKATELTFLEGRWLRTGDLGYFDKDGYLFIKGRSKNIFVGANGENIYPEIIEQQLITHPLISQAVVYMEEGMLTGLVVLDKDVLDESYKADALNAAEREKLVKSLLDEARREINPLLPTFSRLQQLIEHPEPFEMTPTNKVKRYLYLPK